jgi:putative transposase
MTLAFEATQTLPVQGVCLALDVARSSFYYTPIPRLRPMLPPQNALSRAERSEVCLTANSERFCNDSPRAMVARLADEDLRYLCSASSIYRILRVNNLVHERRAQRKHPHYTKPVLMADAINKMWSWDIAKMRGPYKHVFYNAYIVMDLYSRFITGWMVAAVESGELAKQFVAETCAAWKIVPDTLTLHADNGGPMKAKPLYHLLEDLGVAKSHSRPHTSNDNPFSESLFKTTKYHQTYPDHFDDIEQARKWMQEFVNWYNNLHHHSGLAMMTPADVYFGRAKIRQQARQLVMNDAYARNPERFTHGVSLVAAPPTEVWLNKPATEVGAQPISIP